MTTYITVRGFTYDVAELIEEGRRCREHADTIEQHDVDGARQVRVRAERIDLAIGSAR